MKEIKTVSKQEAKELGFAGFSNTSNTPHTIIDLTDVEIGGEHTISVKLPNGQLLTACVIRERVNNGTEGCIDIKLHNEGKTKVIAFDNGKSKDAVGDMHTIIYNNPQ